MSRLQNLEHYQKLLVSEALKCVVCVGVLDAQKCSTLKGAVSSEMKFLNVFKNISS